MIKEVSLDGKWPETTAASEVATDSTTSLNVGLTVSILFKINTKNASTPDRITVGWVLS